MECLGKNRIQMLCTDTFDFQTKSRIPDFTFGFTLFIFEIFCLENSFLHFVVVVIVVGVWDIFLRLDILCNISSMYSVFFISAIDGVQCIGGVRQALIVCPFG